MGVRGRQSQFGRTSDDGEGSGFDPDPSEIQLMNGDFEMAQDFIGPGKPVYAGNAASLVENWQDYLREKEGQRLALGHKMEDEVITIPHTHRWHPQFRRKTYARVCEAREFVEEWYGDRHGNVPVMELGLTASLRDDEGRPRPIFDVLEDLKEGFDDLRRALRRRYEKVGVEFSYFAVFEPHKHGYPHIHVLVFSRLRLDTVLEQIGNELVELWVEKYEIGGYKGQDVRIHTGRESLKNVSAYLMKYLTKTVARESNDGDSGILDQQPSVDGYRVFSAVLWSTGARQYSMSQDLTQAISGGSEDDSDEAEEWEFLGVVEGVDVGRWTGEDAERIRRLAAGRKGAMAPVREESRQMRVGSEYGTRKRPPPPSESRFIS